MAGATLWGRLADACGRRAGFFGTAVFTFAFGLASAGSPNYPVLPLPPLLFLTACSDSYCSAWPALFSYHTLMEVGLVKPLLCCMCDYVYM